MIGLRTQVPGFSERSHLTSLNVYSSCMSLHAHFRAKSSRVVPLPQTTPLAPRSRKRPDRPARLEPENYGERTHSSPGADDNPSNGLFPGTRGFLKAPTN